MTKFSIKTFTPALIALLLLPVSASADTVPENLTLKEAHRLALENNERLNVSRNNVSVAKRDVQEARSELLPQLSVSGESYRQKEVSQFGAPAPEEETNFSASLVQPLYEGGKNIHGLNVRKHEQTMSRFALFRRKQEVLFDVSRIYYNVLLEERNVEIQRNTLKRAQQQLKLAKSRREVGKVTQNAVLRAQVQVSEAQEKLARRKNAVELAREDLAVELGLDSVSETVAEPQSIALTDTSIQNFKSTAYEKRRDLRRAQEQVNALQERVKFEKGDFYPSFSFVGQYDWFDEEQFHGTDEDWRVTLRGSYPLFTGWRDEAQTKRAKIRVKSANEQYERLKREIRRDVRRVHLDLQTQRNVIKTLENRVTQARENHKEITARFEEGLVDAVDVSDAITILNEAELRLASARNTLHLDRIKLKLAAGILSENLLMNQGKKQ